MSYLSTENYSETQKRSAQRVLDSLDQLESRLQGHYAGKRRHSRVKFRGVAKICFRGPDQAVLDPATSELCVVHARSLSQSGLSFIYPGRIEEKSVLVGMELQSSELTWFVAEIVRQKEVPGEGFWEYGVKFLQRAAL